MNDLESILEVLTEEVKELKGLINSQKENDINEINGFISEDDAVKLLEKSKVWFWRKRKEGFLPYKKLGSRIFYSKQDLFLLFEDVS